jgi:secondary thiamine-phosphate synthase enzyme
VRSDEFEIDTTGRLVTDVTATVESFVADAAHGGDGLANVFTPHATCGVALMETGAGSEEDLAEVVGRLLPRDDRYRHAHGSAGHGGDHVLPAFVAPSLTIPVESGSLVLGTWQSVVVVDPNRENNRRRLRVSFLPG